MQLPILFDPSPRPHMDPRPVGTIVLVGPHGAGKSTWGPRIAEAFGAPFCDEIGRTLREERLRYNPDAHALRVDPTFDHEVIQSELARDDAALTGLRVVETGHPGNLAYAQIRSPDVYERFLPQIAKRLRNAPTRTVVVPLVMKHHTALHRLSEPGPNPLTLVEFFSDVALLAREIAAELGIEVLPEVSTDDCEIVVAQTIARRLDTLRSVVGLPAAPAF